MVATRLSRSRTPADASASDTAAIGQASGSLLEPPVIPPDATAIGCYRFNDGDRAV